MEWTLGGTSWHLAEPAALFTLILCPLPWWKRRGKLSWPTLDGFRDAPRRRAGWIRRIPAILLSLAIACMAVALARPRAVGGITRIAGKGVAIVAAIDRSSSMNAADFPGDGKLTSRLEAARSTLARFVQGRSEDLIGLIAFARVPIRVSPPTLDHAFVLEASRSLRAAKIDEDGTNLGYAIVYGLGELREAPARKKVLIVLTDGRDAPASVEGLRRIEPEDAARLAGRLGITLHMIAMGGSARPEEAKSSDPGPDVARLEHLAELGGGKAFTAANAGELDRVFAAIDALEKSPVAGTVRVRYREGYPGWLVAASALILVSRLLTAGPLRRLP